MLATVTSFPLAAPGLSPQCFAIAGSEVRILGDPAPSSEPKQWIYPSTIYALWL